MPVKDHWERIGRAFVTTRLGDIIPRLNDCRFIELKDACGQGVGTGRNSIRKKPTVTVNPFVWD